MNPGRIPIYIFVKPPKPGAVKTRLEPAVGTAGAAALARAFLLDTCAMARSRLWARVELATTGPIGANLASGLVQRSQGEGDLGSRLGRVLRAAVDEAGAAIAIGADSPGLPPERLDRACDALREVDAVLGPASDGGFYLLGLRRCPPGLLEDLTWSRADTFATTLARLHERGLTTAVLEPWFDVDRPEDLDRLAALLETDSITAPETRRTLTALRVSVVMPVLDEAGRIGAALDALAGFSGLGEVIVVDGGSRDETAAIARARGANVLTAPRGRGSQMNAGAAAARGEILLFLHADTALPPDALEHVGETLRSPEVVAGAFRTWTVADGSPPWFAPLLHLADLRSRVTRLPYGDQALFVRADVFRAVGGFPEVALMEDVALSRRLRAFGEIRTCRANVQVSGRRFVARPLFSLAVMNTFPLLYRMGVPAATLARLYGHIR